MMTHEERKRLRELYAKATKGSVVFVTAKAKMVFAVLEPVLSDEPFDGSMLRPDAMLYAVMRESLPALLDDLDAKDAEIERLRAALNQISQWEQGTFVTGSFDCPAHAEIARKALEAP